MTDELRRSIAKLRTSSARLNEVTDRAASLISEVEEFLNGQCSLGVHASVPYRHGSDDTGAHEWYEAICYTRVGPRFRIAIVKGDVQDDNPWNKPWSECDRETKLASIESLPDLLVEISNQLDEKLESANRATESVSTLLDLLGEGSD